MRTCRISEFIYSFNNRIERCIVANGIIGTKKVVINGPWNANNGYIKFFRHNAGSGKSSVTANGNHCLYAELDELIICFLSAFILKKLLATSGKKECSAALYDAAYRL